MTPAPDQLTPGVRRAWGWVAHLRAGGTTPWLDWSDAAEPAGRVVPGAQQLELLRRLNVAGRPGPVLVERVLAASAPGRGRPDLELVGGMAPRAFGPPPVDPGDLSADELLRVATGLVAEDVVALGEPPEPRVARLRPWRTRYRVVGDPEIADPVRAQLVARGRPPGGRGSVILVTGTHLDRMLVDAWTSLCFDEGAPPWPDWVATLARRNQVPRSVDLVRQARAWSGRVGADRVRIVLDPAALPRLVGVRRGFTPAPPVSADATDLARRVGAVLRLLVLREPCQVLLRDTLRPLLAAHDGPALGVPARHAGWLRRRGARMRDDLGRAGYAVHGDLDTLLPARAPAGDPGAVPSDEGTLALAIRFLLDGGRVGAPDDGKERM
ncbi:hypothetical protein H5V45_11070 [Nocardioides sp. KIGAM211]|uniref:Uncharacterized protein n=1 Tax=Nocardioides luti TaxID=2761101 RepID=A0A7X0RGF4_9ACTN|nr:hypothetical protein [Nocardioides luti]MBB6627858.1 hypothetical protein [Nocardioides luti]